MRLIKHLTTWLLLLTVLTASGVVSAKVASGSQNLSGGLYQGNVTANALTHQAKIEFSYDGASGSPVATKKVPKSLKDQAADLIPQNANKHRVTLRSPSQKMEVDLAGKAHGGIPTPHTKVSPRNYKAPNQPAYNTKNAPVRDATQQDIRTVRRYLERQGR
ncbi:MAG: polymorphic toxin type 24 domain-containing protein [Candidatus Sedimenticola sp. (ex Thyasira tokunagai)]